MFQVLDWGTDRADLVSRKETKFALPDMDVGTLRGLLEANCQKLVHNKPVSVVRSVYFDDALLSACYANLNGMGTRRKLRLRWYDSLKPGTGFFLEIKWRDKRITGKHRLQIQSSTALADMTWREIRVELERVMPENLQTYLHRYSDPVVIVQYNREHFSTRDGLRLTLDYDLTFYDQMGRKNISTSFPRRVDGLVVLEGKTPVGREAELRRWLYPFSPRATRCSKYVHGCGVLGLIPKSES